MMYIFCKNYFTFNSKTCNSSHNINFDKRDQTFVYCENGPECSGTKFVLSFCHLLHFSRTGRCLGVSRVLQSSFVGSDIPGVTLTNQVLINLTKKSQILWSVGFPLVEQFTVFAEGYDSQNQVIDLNLSCNAYIYPENLAE